MQRYRTLWSFLAAAALATAGCAGHDSPDHPAPSTGERRYAIEGRVTAVAADRRSVTLDHKDIPGLMKGMEMTFDVPDPATLEGIKAGDQVAGELAVKEGTYSITSLKKR
jgi:Cu/Ag efflux protein CusF